MSSSWTRIRHLTLATTGLWLGGALPAWLIADTAGLEGLTYALLLCLIPGIVTLQLVKAGGGPNQALTTLLLGMGLRMAAVLIGTLVLRKIRPDLGANAFHLWVVVGYLFTLWIETRLLLADLTMTQRNTGLEQPAA